MFSIEGILNLSTEDLVNIIKQRKFEDVELISRNLQKNRLVDDKGRHLLNLAVEYNNLQLIDSLIKYGCDLNTKDSSGMTPLETALTYENFEAVRFLNEAFNKVLIKKLAKPTATSSQLYKLEKQIRRCLRDQVLSWAKNKGLNSMKIGKLLVDIDVSLMNVVDLHDSVVTEYFLKYSKVDFWDDEEIIASVLPKFDLRHIQVLTSCGKRWQNRSYEFFKTILNNIHHYWKSLDGRNLLKTVFSWEIFGKQHLEQLEKVLITATRDSLEIFLQIGFHTIAKFKYNRDLLACLFGNRNVTMTSFLKSEMIDLDGRGYNGNAPIHFAVENKCLENLQFLLDKGVDPNFLNYKQETPLDLALISWDEQWEKFVRTLLLFGADLLIIKKEPKRIGDLLYPVHCYHDYHNNTFQLIIAQFAIYQAQGLLIEKSLRYYFEVDWYAIFYKGYCNQIFQMKNWKIRDNCRGTIFTILTEIPEMFLQFINEKEVLRMIDIFTENNKNRINYYYLEILKKQRVDVQKMMKVLKDKAKHVVSESIGIHDPYNLVVERIVDYISSKDLLKFEL